MLATYSLTYLTLPPNLLSQSKIFISHAHAKTETGFIDSPGPCAYRQDGETPNPNPNPKPNPNRQDGEGE